MLAMLAKFLRSGQVARARVSRGVRGGIGVSCHTCSSFVGSGRGCGRGVGAGIRLIVGWLEVILTKSLVPVNGRITNFYGLVVKEWGGDRSAVMAGIIGNPRVGRRTSSELQVFRLLPPRAPPPSTFLPLPL